MVMPRCRRVDNRYPSSTCAIYSVCARTRLIVANHLRHGYYWLLEGFRSVGSLLRCY